MTHDKIPLNLYAQKHINNWFVFTITLVTNILPCENSYKEIISICVILNGKIQSYIFYRNGIESKDHEKHAYWLKREGEEYYFYYSVDALLSEVLLFSFQADLNKKERSSAHWDEIMVLSPIGKEYNKFLNRLCYSELLKDTLEIFDSMHYPVEAFDGKRIIHFKKMPLSQAIKVCETIVRSEPENYPQLAQVITDLKKYEK